MSEEKKNTIGRDFTTWQLVWFATPAFLNNLCTSVFNSLDDGLFVSRYVGQDGLGGIKILSPIDNVRIAISHLLSLGGATLSAKKMGEGKQQEAKEIFTKVAMTAFCVGTLFSLLLNLFPQAVFNLFGADEVLSQYSIYSIRTVYAIIPLTLTNTCFNAYYSTAGKPSMGLLCSIVNGTINITLDIVLVVVLKMGVLGATLSTMIGDIVIFMIGLIFFCNRNHEIHFVRIRSSIIPTVTETAKSGLPQSINALSLGFTNTITNHQLLSYIGNNGVSANAIINDIRKIFSTSFVGFSTCVGPIIAYNYGEKNIKRLKTIMTQLLKIWLFGSVIFATAGQLLRKPFINVFLGDNDITEYYTLVYNGLTIEMFSTIFTAGCLMLSRIFISLSCSREATIQAVFRTLIFRALTIIVLPMAFGEDGIWYSMPLSELLSLSLGAVLLYCQRSKFGFGKEQ